MPNDAKEGEAFATADGRTITAHSYRGKNGRWIPVAVVKLPFTGKGSEQEFTWDSTFPTKRDADNHATDEAMHLLESRMI